MAGVNTFMTMIYPVVIPALVLVRNTGVIFEIERQWLYPGFWLEKIAGVEDYQERPANGWDIRAEGYFPPGRSLAQA